jgi:methionyl-tRNA formyltransferase
MTPDSAHPLRVVLMGRKVGAAQALITLLNRGYDVVAVVPSESDERDTSGLREIARDRGIPVMTHEEVHIAAGEASRDPLNEVDLVISYLHSRKIRPPLIQLPRIGCFNFHPAPLPELRGLGGYNFAILQRMPYYGVSVHWVAPRIDEGHIVRVNRFPINPDHETALLLESKAQEALSKLLSEFLEIVESGMPIPAIPQGAGRYITRSEMEEAKRILQLDSAESVDRKARAFWFPPFTGAFVEISGKRFTVVPDCMLEQLALHVEGRLT